jgi:serine/threonine-protein kinase HipA
MKLTEDYEEIEKIYRQMCFNVFAHNRDDHSKNFTYLYDDKEDKWHLSPAYDLTYSNTYYGEHTTTVDGNGRDPGRKELLAVGIAAGMKKGSCEKIIDEIQTYVKQMLREYLERCQ